MIRELIQTNAGICAPSYRAHVESIESVPKLFLFFTLSTRFWDQLVSLPLYENRLLRIDFASFLDEISRLMSDIFSLEKSINDLIDLPADNCTISDRDYLEGDEISFEQ